jgi:2-keto-4-pentenoate hydratase/2-oxohepta-3-ene-1,7-dioic acid hydratase in catechol pathway
MKIICIGRNYAAHAKEMKSELPSEPVFFMKPETALLREGDFYYPDFTADLHHEIELVVRISKAGKHISKAFAHKYFDAITLGIDFTARDIQEQCKKKGLPWEKAKAFDNSAPIGTFLEIGDKDLNNLTFSLQINSEKRQEGNTGDMIFNIAELISYISQYVSLKVGDLLFTGTPEGVGPVNKGDVIQGYLSDKKLIEFKIK